jgi:hypothetical protein
VISYETENDESVVSNDLISFMTVISIHEDSAVVPNVTDYSPKDTRQSVKRKDQNSSAYFCDNLKSGKHKIIFWVE